MSKCLRQELKEYNVKVTSILPGATRTGSWDGTSLGDERFVNPDDICEQYGADSLRLYEMFLGPLEQYKP